MIKRIELIITIVTVCIIVYAQVSEINTPASFNVQIDSKIPIVEIKNQIYRTLTDESKLPVQAGYTLPFNQELLKMGEWVKVSGIHLWRLEIFAPNANALNIYLHKLKIASDEKLFIYNPNKSDVTEIYYGATCTDFIEGDRIIIEFNTKSRSNHIPIFIEEIGVRFTPSNDRVRGFGGAGDCEVHINCIEGEDWQNEKKGVARILVKQDNLTFWCTGSLINNTRNDGTPYFLTANHCGELADSTDYSKWLFYFDYESENCTQPTIEPEHNTISGSTLLANSLPGTNAGSDFKLLLLDENIPSSYMPYYNGWDRSGLASPTGVTIHHPQGDVKMISTYTNQLVSTKYNNNNEDPNGMYWQVHWSETQSGHGVTEGGSSGCPIFNNEGNIVGALTGGSASCSFVNEPDYYGKISYSWESNNNDPSSNLGYWLDPMNTGTNKLKGTNLDSTNIYAGFSGEPNSIIVGGSVSFINTSFGNISGYSWHFEGGIPEYSELEEPGNIKYLSAGAFDVQLIVSSANGSDTLTSNDYITVLPNISPNPSKGKIKLAFGSKIPSDYAIRIFNTMGQETNYIIDEISDNYLIIDIFPNKKGTYLIKLSSSQINNTYKVIIIGN